MHHLEHFRKNILIFLAVSQHSFHRFQKLTFFLPLNSFYFSQLVTHNSALILGQVGVGLAIKFIKHFSKRFQIFLFKGQFIRLKKMYHLLPFEGEWC